MTLSHHSFFAEPLQARREVSQLLALLLLVKCGLLVVDPTLRYFMGDSGTYLHSALTGWIPPDRSFTYPWLVRVSAVAAQSASALVVLQTLLGLFTSICLYLALRAGAAVPRAAATLAALLLSIEPAQLFYERMLMAESGGALAFIAFLALTVLYVRDGRLRWIAALVPLGLLAVSMRMSLLPVVLGMSLAAPLLRGFNRHRQEDAGRPLVAVLRAAGHLVVMLAVTAVMHGAYKQAYAALSGGEPDYMGAQGQMRLGLVAPLIKPEHLQRAGVPLEVLNQLGHPLEDHRAREAQIWMHDGLFSRMQAVMPPHEAQRAAKKIAVRALQDDPLGLVRMGLATFGDYFDDGVALHRLSNDLGDVEPDAAMLQDLRRTLRQEAQGLFHAQGLAAWLFSHSRWWLTFVLFALAPLAVWALFRSHCDPGRRAALLVLATAGLGLVASQLLFAHIVSFRYLHPLPPVFIGLAVLVLASHRWSRSAGAGV
jgi:hypothetical protein